MPRFVSFSYSDLLSAKGKENLHPELVVSDGSCELLIILRMLSGGIKLINNYSGDEISCRKNFFSSDLKGFGQNWKTKFPKLISENVNANDIGEFIKANKFINRTFYKNILAEISHYFFSTHKQTHATAFIYVYRLLEKVSYAFPLIYASKTKDFVRSYNHLKELMTGESEKGELGFFKQFVQNLYSGNPIMETSVDMNFEIAHSSVQDQIFKEIKNVLEPSIIHADTVESIKLSIKFYEMASFIITVRNRFFHNFNGGARNIQSFNFPDADLLFKPINDPALQWIASVFLEIITFSVSEFLRLRSENA